MKSYKREVLKDVPLYHIKPYDKNYQDHKDNIDHIANSIKDFGYNKVSITVDEDMIMLTGHGTLGALEKLSYKQVPLVLQISGLSEKQKKAFRIADNESSKAVTINDEFLRLELDDIGLDFDMRDYGLDFELPAETPPSENDDAVPEPPAEPITKLGDVIELGKHRLVCGDSTCKEIVEKLMNGEKADMVFTDPPYGDNHASMDMDFSMVKKGRSFVAKSNKIKSDANLDFLAPAVEAINEHLKDNSTKMMFFKWKKWGEILDKTQIWGDPSACCVWDRDDIAAAVFRFNPTHEFCFHWGKQTDKHKKSNLTNVWRCKKEYENKKLHPTVKPIEIIQPCIEVCTDSKNLVVDLFGGSGSTLIACEKTNRKCYMMELDPVYCDVIIQRWLDYTNSTEYIRNGKIIKI